MSSDTQSIYSFLSVVHLKWKVVKTKSLIKFTNIEIQFAWKLSQIRFSVSIATLPKATYMSICIVASNLELSLSKNAMNNSLNWHDIYFPAVLTYLPSFCTNLC